jgi:hypothetical protein
MPQIKYQWIKGAPGDKTPSLWITCLSNENYTAPRYWDGSRWWAIERSRGRACSPFVWPKGCSTGPFARYAWMKKYPLRLRNISDQTKVRFGIPFKHFTPEETLQWLVQQGRLPADWKEAYQDDMRAAKGEQ